MSNENSKLDAERVAFEVAQNVKAEQVRRDATELALLREYRLSGIAFNDAQGEGYTVEQSNRAEQRMEAAEKACWDFYAGRKPAPSLPAAGLAGLTFNALRAANAERICSSKYRKCEENWTPAHWMQATVGELGELANLLKKVDRGDFPFDDVKSDVAKELADVQTYLDILALKLGVDLGRATIDKFNEVSERIGSPVRLDALSAQQSAPERVSVPVELLERLCARKSGESIDDEYAARAELRAILASHSEGGKV